ncbi:MAG: hypothetical protein KDA85_16875 [Planctomycetaceae bacterium]|nr:hypothetical protein [Planctomycetaceae bacterium]
MRSNTGEFSWNYGSGLCTINAPAAQGAIGDLASGGMIQLDSITINSRNEYASVVAVAMDDQPLATSRQVLLQIGTTARPYGWKTESATNNLQRIVSLGSSPWNMAETKLEMTIKNPGLTQATLLDANGVAVEQIPVSRQGQTRSINLPANAMYVILR